MTMCALRGTRKECEVIMEILLKPVEKEDIKEFKKDMQEAFQKGAMEEFNDLNVEILSEKDLMQLNFLIHIIKILIFQRI